MKLLIKRAFKSIFKNKFFMALMFILIALSGTAFTVLDSSANSFRQSYNSVVVDGNLHDAVVKENFKVEPGSSLTLGIYNDQTSTVDPIDEAHLQTDRKFVSANNWNVDLRILDATNGYSSVGAPGTKVATIPFADDGQNGLTSELAQVEDAANKWKTDLITKIESGMSDQFTSVINQIYGSAGTNELIAENTKSLSVSVGDDAYKLVRTDNDSRVNDLIMYDGTSNFTKPRTTDEMKNELLDSILGKGLTENDYTFNTLKGYKVTATSAGAGSDILSAIDPSSFQAVVSPAYANANNKHSISPKVLLDQYIKDPLFFDKVSSTKPEYKYLQDQYEENLVYVDKTPYFIIGIGTRPDFSYPIIDEQHPTVDINNQAILFVNESGYSRAMDGWRTNPQEDYISLKYNHGVSHERIAEIEDEISDLLLNGNTSIDLVTKYPQIASMYIPTSFFPSNIDVVTKSNDPNDIMLLTQERTSVLSTLQKTISALSTATTTLLIIFVAAIVILVFQVLISINRKSLSTLIALGYSRTKIATSTAFIALVIGLLPTALGYLTGFGLQYPFINSFDEFWTLPAYGDPFSWLSFVVVVGVPFLLLGLLIFIIVLLSLRHPIPLMLKDSVKEESPHVAKIVSKLRVFGPRGRYSAALTFKNGGKLVLAGLTMTISLITMIVGLSTSGTAARAYNATSKVNDYDYRIDLYSPTKEGGNYQRINSDEDYGGLLSTNAFKETYAPGSGYDPSMPHWHIPGQYDANYGLPTLAGDPTNILKASRYLENKLQVKVLLDEEVASLNPWSIASRLMPENQLNSANQDAEYFENWNGFRPKRAGEDDKLYKIEKFKAMLRTDKEHVPYIISYKNVITNSADNVYTYIDGTMDIDKEAYNYKIIGLQNTEDIAIDGDELSALDKYASSNQNTVPVLVNHYMSEYLGLNVGDTFDILVNNDSNRNFASHSEHHVKGVVRGVVDGYDDGGIYTTQNVANRIIDLGNDGFNGVFANEENPAILQTMPLYSPSGLYIGTDTIIGDWEQVLSKMLVDPRVWTFGNSITNDPQEFFRLYSRTPYVGATSSVHWQAIDKSTFKNTSDLTNTMIYLIESISIAISVIFMSIVSLLFFVSNKKKIATLWTLGYRKREIIRMFMATYMIPLFVSILIAVPAAIGILYGMRMFIIGFGHILIPLSITIWAPFVAVGIVSLIFIIATILSVVTQRPDKNLAAFKE